MAVRTTPRKRKTQGSSFREPGPSWSCRGKRKKGETRGRGSLLHVPAPSGLLPSPYRLSPSQKPGSEGCSTLRTAQSSDFCVVWVGSEQPGRCAWVVGRVKDNVGQHVTCDKPQHLRIPEGGSWGSSWKGRQRRRKNVTEMEGGGRGWRRTPVRRGGNKRQHPRHARTRASRCPQVCRDAPRRRSSSIHPRISSPSFRRNPYHPH